MTNTDLTFITNEEQQNLKARFQSLIKDTRFFDCLVGYFYTSGFHAIYKSLENTEKIRILIGISTSKQTYDLLTEARNTQQQSLQFSPTERQPFEVLVDRILAAKQRDPAADIRTLEAKIDRLVYALYGLTDEEIRIVEGRT